MQVEKRKYRKGYNINFPGSVHSQTNRNSLSAARVSAGKKEINKPADHNLTSSFEKPAKAIVKENKKTVGYAAGLHKRQHSNSTISTLLSPSKEKKEDKLSAVKYGTFSKIISGNIPLFLYGGIAGIMASLFLYFKRKSARGISEWAKANKVKARSIIALSNIAMGVGGFTGGCLLYHHGVSISQNASNALLGLTIGGTLLYPVRNSSSGLLKSGYIRQKMNDLFLALSGMMLLTSTGNLGAAQINPVASEILSISPFKNVVSDEEKLLTCANRITSSNTNKHTGIHLALTIILKILAFLFATAAFLFLLILIAGLSCGLSCSGNQGLAALVGFGGTLLAILLYVLVLRLLFRKKKSNTEIPVSDTETSKSNTGIDKSEAPIIILFIVIGIILVAALILK
jgi:hypothetical protein